MKIKTVISVLCFTIGMCLIWSVALHSAAGVGVGLCIGVAFAAAQGIIFKSRKNKKEKTDEVVK